MPALRWLALSREKSLPLLHLRAAVPSLRHPGPDRPAVRLRRDPGHRFTLCGTRKKQVGHVHGLLSERGLMPQYSLTYVKGSHGNSEGDLAG